MQPMILPFRLAHKQAAAYLGVSPKKLDGMRIPCCREALGRGGRRYYLREDLERYARRSKEREVYLPNKGA